MKFTQFYARILVFLALCVFGGGVVNAQERVSPDFEEKLMFDTSTPGNTTNGAEAEPLPVDSAMISGLSSLPRMLKKWEKKHFASYLATTCTTAGALLGVCVALLAHFNTPPHGRWTEVRKKSSLMATSIGVGLAVLLVTLHFSVPAHAKITYLILALILCSSSAGIGCALGLSILRKLRILRAKKLGIRLDSERLWTR